MNLFRLLLLGAAIYFVWRFLSRTQRPVPATVRGDAARSPRYEAMQRCTGCGTHLPARSLSAAGRCTRCDG